MQEKYVYPAAWCAVLGFLSFTFQPYSEGRLLSKAQWLSNDIQGFQLSPKLPSTHKTSRKASMSLWSLVTTLTKTLFVCPCPIKQHILVVSPTVVSPQVLWKCRMHRGTWSVWGFAKGHSPQTENSERHHRDTKSYFQKSSYILEVWNLNLSPQLRNSFWETCNEGCKPPHYL